MINSRKLEDLHPRVQALCEKFIGKCHELGIDVLITSTYRDYESQNALFAQGRTVDGKIVTNAMGGQSYHNFRVAFDFVPIVGGKPRWDDMTLFANCGKIAESVGLEWAGRWVRFKEMAHCQFTDGLTLQEFRDGKTIGGSDAS
jgi:peptidoglycan LD-endopeptidase CwlK